VASGPRDGRGAGAPPHGLSRQRVRAASMRRSGTNHIAATPA
jgi:hypothetical protein